MAGLARGRAPLAALLFCALVLALLLLLRPARETDRARLEQILQKTVGVLEASRADYWVAGGTLFGAYLSGRVQLDDFDADLMVTLESVPRIRTADWTAAGLLCYEGFGGFRIKASSLDTLRVDLFVRRVADDGRLVYAWPPMDTMYTKALLPAHFVFPLQKIKMAGFTVYGPAKPHEALTYEYGTYSREPPWSWRDAAVGALEREIWARAIPAASYFSPIMPY